MHFMHVWGQGPPRLHAQQLPLSTSPPSTALTANTSMQQINCARSVAGTHAHLSLQVTGHNGQEKLGEALKGADLVIIPAGVPRKPGMTRDDLFNINASIVQKLAQGVAEHAPKVCTLAS